MKPQLVIAKQHKVATQNAYIHHITTCQACAVRKLGSPLCLEGRAAAEEFAIASSRYTSLIPEESYENN